MNLEELKAYLDEAVKSNMGEQMKAMIDESMKGIQTNVTESLDKRFGILKTTNDAREDKEVSAKFFKALYGKDTANLTKAMVEGTGSAGGFIVPEEFTAQVYRIVEDFGLVMAMATKLTMNTDTLNVPTLGSSVSITYPGEANAGSQSQPVLRNVQLLSKTGVGLTAMSNELLADANVSTVDLLARLFAEAIAGEVDAQALAGTGSPFTGILNDLNVNVVTMATGQSTFSSVTLADTRDLITQIKPWALQGAGYIMHRTIWAVLQKARTGGTNSGDFFGASQNPIIIGAPQGFPNATAGFLWGYPVYLSDKMPSATQTAISTKFMIFGNLSHVFYGDRATVTVSMFDSGTVGSINLIDQNMSGLRITIRHAIAVGLPEAFAVLKTSAS